MVMLRGAWRWSFAIAVLAMGCYVKEIDYVPLGDDALAVLSMSPDGDLALGTVIVGKMGAISSVTLSNDGEQSSGPITVAVDDDALGFRLVADECTGTSLPAKHTCKFGVQFSAAAAGAVDTMVRATAAPGGNVTKAVLGTGLFQGTVDITVDGHDFGDYRLGAPVQAATLVIRNSGTMSIDAPSSSTSGGDASFTVASTTCAGALEPNATCTVVVQWQPAAVGNKSGSLVVSSPMGGQDAATLSGRAVARVTVVRSGSGGGSVASSGQPGITCGTACEHDFDTSPIALTANPAPGSLFTGWGADCSGPQSCSLVLDRAKSVAATFEPQLFAITVAIQRFDQGNHRVVSSPAGIDCTAATSPCSAMFPSGAQITLTATPDAQISRFIGWANVDCTGPSSTPTCTFTVGSEPENIAAVFDWYAVVQVISNMGDLASRASVASVAGTFPCDNTTTLSGDCGFFGRIPIGPGSVAVQFGSALGTSSWEQCQQQGKTVSITNLNGSCVVQGSGCSFQSTVPGTVYRLNNPISCL
jgi:hypothetical protein